MQGKYKMFEVSHSEYESSYKEILSLFQEKLSTAIFTKQNHIITIREGYITLPLSGRIEVFISDRPVGHVGYNTPLGLIPKIENYSKNIHIPLKYRALMDMSVLMIKSDDWWLTVLRRPDLLRGLIGIQNSLVAMLIATYDDMAQNSQYKVIRSLIYRYDYLNSRGLLHHKCSLPRFISSRRRGGDSYMFKVLKCLSDSGFLVYKKNTLQIIKELPRDL